MFYKKYGILKAEGEIENFLRSTNSKVYFNYEEQKDEYFRDYFRRSDSGDIN